MEGWRQSQVSQKAYCKQHSISFSRFAYWRSRLKHKVVPDKKLIPVAMARTTGSVALFLPNGIRMDVPVCALSEVLHVISQTEQVLS